MIIIKGIQSKGKETVALPFENTEINVNVKKVFCNIYNRIYKIIIIIIII